MQPTRHLSIDLSDPPGHLQTPVGDLLVSFTKDQNVLDEALPDAIYYAGIYSLILLATTITVSITIPLFSALAAGLFGCGVWHHAVHVPARRHSPEEAAHGHCR